ncbi:uncharacterized protein EAF01_004591 [Botrytis porri]|uniref:uncharacterized protein n=1 Tax=Botrytis porri TaxID=87229 RepID=UPI001901ABA9|nr:uncharacterized protein EAF01_004591 [Botrytis porri]KAF7907004.1 hypothetical protein EAF01_004591 [Botrytis porri]
MPTPTPPPPWWWWRLDSMTILERAFQAASTIHRGLASVSEYSLAFLTSCPSDDDLGPEVNEYVLVSLFQDSFHSASTSILRGRSRPRSQ